MGGAVKTISGGLPSIERAAGDVINKGIGGGLSQMNPFHPLNYSQMAAPAAPTTVNGPTGAPKSAPSVAKTPGAAAATAANADAVSGAVLGGVGSDNAFRQSQLNTINGLQGVASGAVNPAQAMMAQNMGQNTASQFAMANSARGGAQASAMRNAMNNAQVDNSQAAVQGAQLGLQNQMNAAGLQGQLAGQGYGQDINVANANAANQQQASLANQQSQLSTNQFNAANLQQANLANYQGQLSSNQMNAQLQNNFNQLGAQYAQMGVGAQEANQQANLAYQNQLMGQQSFNTNTSLAAQGAQRQAIGNFASGLGGAAAGSKLLGGTGTSGGGIIDSIAGLFAHGGLVPPHHVLLARMAGSY